MLSFSLVLSDLSGSSQIPGLLMAKDPSMSTFSEGWDFGSQEQGPAPWVSLQELCALLHNWDLLEAEADGNTQV